MQTTVNKNYLCRRFKQETSVTVFECLMIIRVRKALEGKKIDFSTINVEQ